ncbi:hypothetical protein FK268_14185 [Tsukamurella sputi]|uniref:DoxX family protein n=1 Tax=Tsukamurella sputi TaxID=2591848 RepID=A0A5C5RLA3_9ACTN|nr:hypothetical protein [Tsukamurella sputi]TWS23432.1 hypothetical protein FK268_14185 [Tsukamurella sputi]
MSAPQSPMSPMAPVGSAGPFGPAGPVTPPAPPAPEPQWSGAQKLAFRLLFVLGGGIVLLSLYGNAGLALLWKSTGIWWALAQIGSYISRGEGVDIVVSSGGDNMWQWCMHLGWIVVGLVIVAVWTALDRNRPNYRSLLGLLGVLARFVLAISMIIYGLAKAIPTQMGFMILPSHQLQLTGDTSMFTTLWGFMGASIPYMVITGLIELTAGILLLWRRTTLLGALIAIVAMGQVFLLNLFYDVPVKLVAGELLIVAVALTLPAAPNLLRVVFNRPAPTPVTPLPVAGAGPAWSRITGQAVKFSVAGLMFVLIAAQGVLMTYVIHTPRSDLDGVWRATSFSIDGAPAGLTQRDPAPWSNVAITLRGSTSNTTIAALGEQYDSVVTQEPSGYTTAWRLDLDGDVLELRKREEDAPLRVTARLEGDRLHLTGTLRGKSFDGVYERRFMERERSHFRFVQPDDPGATSPEQGGS